MRGSVPMEGPTVVLLHSSGSSARQWRDLVETLQPRYRVRAIDFHGHGVRSDWGGGSPMALADDAALVEPLLEEARGAHLVGHSYGGAVALKLAALHPQWVRSVVAYEPVMFRLLFDDAASRQPAQEVAAVADWIRDRLLQGEAASAARRFVEFWSGADAWRYLAPGRQNAIAARMRSVLRNFEALFHEPPGMSGLGMPLSILTGAGTVNATRRIGELLRAELPDAQHEVLPEMGHMGPITRAAQVNRRITQFLRANESDTRRFQQGDHHEPDSRNTHAHA